MTSQSERISMMEQLFGKPFEDKPIDGIYGILYTKDYERFNILNDFGNIIYSFEGAKFANKCLSGDHVCWKDNKCNLELRDAYPQIVGTIELTSKLKYGITSRGVPIYLFIPYNKSYPPFIVGCSEKDISRNKIGLIKFDDWTMSSTFPRGLLQQILGNSGDFEAEKQALIWQTSPWKYPKKSISTKMPISPLEPVILREELKGYTFNIDPSGCIDIDDVFTFEKLDDNSWRVTITISDVASYIENGSEVDIMSSLIGETLYDDNGAVLRPMLPSEYSEVTCSLLPGKKSLGISLQFIWYGSEISNIRWFESIFENNKSYTYDEFNTLKLELKDPFAKIVSYLAKEDILDSHKLVEHMMIFYNIEAGKLLKKSGMGVLRRHSESNHSEIAKCCRAQINSPDIKHLAMSAAEYCLAEEDNTRHFGLLSNTYAHASSPIRRYADLLNQRVLKIIIKKSEDRYIIPISMFDMNLRSKAIRSFERDLSFLIAITNSKSCSFTGTIIDTTICKSTPEYLKIKIYVHEWKRIISTKYHRVDDSLTLVLSRDEKREIIVAPFVKVNIICAININARNWKDRIIINI